MPVSVIGKMKGPSHSKKDLRVLKDTLKRRMDHSQQAPEPKKRFSGGLFILILAAILTILVLQNLSNHRSSRVAFSHQVEHLINLDLIHKDKSQKIAQNDNLVTFTGKFKEELSEESRMRFRYLELLHRQQEYREGEKELMQKLFLLQDHVKAAAERFLTLSGIPISSKGYLVVDSILDTPDRENRVVIYPFVRQGLSLVDLHTQYEALARDTTSDGQALHLFGHNLKLLIQGFLSPALGVGNEKMKSKLREANQRMESLAENGALTPQELLAHYHDLLKGLDQIVDELNRKERSVRLQELRSVRDYLIYLEQFNQLKAGAKENEAQLNKARGNVLEVTWFFNNRELSTKALEKQAFEEFNLWFAQAKKEWENLGSSRGMSFKAPDQPRNLVLEKTFKSQEPSPNYFSYIFLTLLPVILVILVLYFVFSRQMKGIGSHAMNFGKSPARMLNKNLHKVTFHHVAGIDEAKEELNEIVDFLKDPSRFTALGARIPKGVLLIGPPGTGKTLIAKAVAGEADRPFFSISGSDFVEMFVGVGASRIRDLFEQAKKNAPCIVFVDEIDAVGRHRGAGIGGGHDEREQTLNQLLVEMDGFDTNEGVILMAATNRPDVLDRALLRPGRFDRQVVLDLPDIKGRFAILKVHARQIKLEASVDLMIVARATPGSSGADLMNILNESALSAARKGRSAVTIADTLEACDKVRYGRERRSLEMDQQEKWHTAYHEAGHAIVGLSVEHADPIEKVTIIPRGLSLGATHFIPEKNKLSHWKKELIDRLAVLMGGRVAEEMFIGDISSGAQSDIDQATKLARSMVCQWGMHEDLGPVSYRKEEGQPVMVYGESSKGYSEETAREIDRAVRMLIGKADKEARDILSREKKAVDQLARILVEFEVANKEDIRAVMDGTWDRERKEQKLKEIAECSSPPESEGGNLASNPGDPGNMDPSLQQV